MATSALANQYLADQAPWALVKTDRERAATVLYVALRAVDSLKTLFTPFLPFSSQVLHELLGYEGWIAGPLEFRTVEEDDGSTHEVLTGDYASWVGSLGAERAAARPEAARAAAALPQARRRASSRARGCGRAPRDRHARAPRRRSRTPTRLSRAPREAGVTRILTVGTDVATAAGARARRARTTGVFAILGIHPHDADDATDGRRRRAARAARASEGGRRRARWASTGSATTRRATRSGALFAPQLELAADSGKPVVIHTRAADDDTLAALDRFDGTRRPALLLVAAPAPDRARARLVRLVRRQRDLPEGGRPPPRRDAGARRAHPRRDRRAVPRAAAGPRQAERAGVRRPHARRARAGPRRGSAPSSSGRSTRTRPSASGSPMNVAPKKRLGQHFLVDENILGVIGRLAELDAGRRRARDRPRARRADALPRRARRARARRRDRPLARAAPRATLATNVDARTSATRCSSTCAARPDATKLVANLPYNVATPLLVESLDGLPDVELWCVMVQREVADRLFAEPEHEGVRRRLGARRSSPPSAPGFHPGLAHRLPAAAERRLGARRLPAHGAAGGLRPRQAASSRAAFAHRRKTLPNSLALAGLATRERAAAGARGDRPRADDPRRGARAGGVRRARRGARDEPSARAGEDQPRARRRAAAPRRQARGR